MKGEATAGRRRRARGPSSGPPAAFLQEVLEQAKELVLALEEERAEPLLVGEREALVHALRFALPLPLAHLVTLHHVPGVQPRRAGNSRAGQATRACEDQAGH